MSKQKESLKRLIPMDREEAGPIKGWLLSFTNDVLERVLSVRKIRRIHEAIPCCEGPFQCIETALKHLNIRYAVRNGSQASIPASGPTIVVSNHPFGGIDGMILAHVLSTVRQDIKILVNYLLMAIPDMSPLFFAVDPFGKQGSARKNMVPLGRAVRWVKNGGLLMVFPAGEVSHLTWRRFKVEDPPWSKTVSRLIHMTKAQVLPVYFNGRNSMLFQMAGLIHPFLRTVMLPRELLKKEAQEIQLKIGRLIPYRSLNTIRDPSELTEYLRFRTSLLEAAFRGHRRLIRLPERAKPHHRTMEGISHPQDAATLAHEVACLAPEQKLIETQGFSVYYARSRQMPKMLQEIGRLREETFRLAGEGTGKSIDLDRFDNIYIHLFVWNHEKKEVVGAYRLGPSDEILPKHGKKGFYTHTLFKYRNGFLDRMGPALEMGRTFVRASYQRRYSPLLLLWKGIGQFVSQNPRYKILFGAVSISNDYLSYSRQLMVAFLKMNNYRWDLSGMVKPRRRFREKNIKGLNEEKARVWGDDLEDLSSWISGLEDDGKGVPILLKQYIRLGGKLLSFNVDQAFGNALDGLILVDLTQTEDRVLRKYMGKRGFERFKGFHSGRLPRSGASDSTRTSVVK